METSNEADISHAALAEKYQQEREKRLRTDGDAQYTELTGRYRDFDIDPWAEPDSVRGPVARDTDAVIVGAGFGGMLAAARLSEAGISDLMLIDKAGDFGGTWYWNRYPGAACDIESYIYMPLLEETGYIPSEKYAKSPEIFAYCQRLGRDYDLYRRSLFQTQVTGTYWDEKRTRWIVDTNRGDRIATRFLVVAGGMLHKAKLPGIAGIDSFEGHSFHTSRWDYGYTGGGPGSELTGLADKRVAIIGTGATAIQAVPHLAANAKQLFVVQRTPSSVSVRGNRPTDAAWAASLTPGWQRQRMENFAAITAGERQDIDLVEDGWTEMYFYAPDNPTLPADKLAEHRRARDFDVMNKIRQRVSETVTDAATAEALKPWYDPLCKRPGFHDEFLPTFNLPNVTLIDTQGRGVDRITPKGIVVGDTEYPVDCIIYASGFEVMTDYVRRIGFDIVGRGGLSLRERWKDGVHSLYGMHSHGFPNLIMISATQGGWSVNVMHMLNEQAIHVAHVVRDSIDRGIATSEPTEAAEQEWLATIMSYRPMIEAFQKSCTPSYINGEGAVDERFGRNNAFMGGTRRFLEILYDWRAAGMPGMATTSA